MKPSGWLEVNSKFFCKPLRCVINIVHLIIGIEPPTDKKIWIERKVPLTEEEKNEPVDRPFQYVGKCKFFEFKLFNCYEYDY